jgi:hypothetical protein
MLLRRTRRPVRTRDVKAKHISNLLHQLVWQPTVAVPGRAARIGDERKAADGIPKNRRLCCLREPLPASSDFRHKRHLLDTDLWEKCALLSGGPKHPGGMLENRCSKVSAIKLKNAFGVQKTVRGRRRHNPTLGYGRISWTLK